MFGLRVRDVMTSDPVVVVEDLPLKEVARALFEGGVSGVPVVDRAGLAVGVISETDLLRFEEVKPDRGDGRRRSLVALFVQPERASRFQDVAEGVVARDVMSTPVFSIEPEASVAEAIRTVLRDGVHRLVVVAPDGSPTGIVSMHDLLTPLLRSDEDVVEEVRTDVIPWLLGQERSHVAVSVNDGVLRLTGHVEGRALTEALARRCERVPGVTRVVNDITWCIDEKERPAPERVEPAIVHAQRTVRLG